MSGANDSTPADSATVIVTSIPVRPRAVDRQGLLLLPPGKAVPRSLLDAMRKRGLSPRIVNDLPAVMVERALHPVSFLILVEPGHWKHLDELARAMERYYPGTLCWRFHLPDARWTHGRLEPWAWKQVVSVPQAPPPSAAELSGPCSDPALPRRSHRPVSEPLLTREELDMLLNHSWERTSRSRRPRQRHDADDGL